MLGSRTRSVHAEKRRYTAQTKGFTVRTLCLPHETPPQYLARHTGCLVLRISRKDLRPTTNRSVVLLFQPRRENGRVFLVIGHFDVV